MLKAEKRTSKQTKPFNIPIPTLTLTPVQGLTQKHLHNPRCDDRICGALILRQVLCYENDENNFDLMLCSKCSKDKIPITMIQKSNVMHYISEISETILRLWFCIIEINHFGFQIKMNENLKCGVLTHFFSMTLQFELLLRSIEASVGIYFNNIPTEKWQNPKKPSRQWNIIIEL